MMFFLCFWPYSQESTCVGASKVPNFCKNTYFDEHLRTAAFAELHNAANISMGHISIFDNSLPLF